MPLTVNVGLSRKASENYQSKGVSINVSAELDQSLLASPARLQDEIAGLYRQAESALADQADGGSSHNHHHTSKDANGERAHNGDSGNHRDRQSNGHRPATSSQMRALRAIADRLRTNLDDECHEEFGLRPNELGIRQASQLIDILKQRQSDRQDREPSRSGGSRR